jgi:4-hydroxy-tetrahydrodipicolinate synthase
MILEGIGVAMVTPFTRDGAPDVKALEILTERLCRTVDFLVPLGTTGETPTLSRDEADTILEVVGATNGGRLPLVVGCGGNHTSAVAERMLYLEKRFAPAAFLSVSPYYNKPTQEGIYRHYSTLADRVNTPIVLYDVPGRTGRGMSPETVERLARRPNIVGLKDASGSLEQANELCLRLGGGEFALISGDDKYAFAHKQLGYRAVISVAANVLGSMMKKLWNSVGSTSLFQENKEQYRKFIYFSELIFEEGSPAGIKSALEYLNICTSTVRLPLVGISDTLSQRISELLKEIEPIP